MTPTFDEVIRRRASSGPCQPFHHRYGGEQRFDCATERNTASQDLGQVAAACGSLACAGHGLRRRQKHTAAVPNPCPNRGSGVGGTLVMHFAVASSGSEVKLSGGLTFGAGDLIFCSSFGHRCLKSAPGAFGTPRAGAAVPGGIEGRHAHHAHVLGRRALTRVKECRQPQP